MPRPRAQCRSACWASSQSKLGCLPDDHDVDVVLALQAVGHRGQQGVGVRRQVDAHDLGLLVEHVVDEAGVLVGEAVVVLAPHVRAQQVVEARDARTPLDLAGGLEPLGVLVEHRVDEVDEGLVAAEEPVPPGQQVALEPALARVLGEDLHHPTGPGEVLVDVVELARPDLVGHLVDRVEPVGRGLVGPEDAEVGVVVADHADEPLAQHAGRLVDGRARTLHLDGALPPVGQAQRPLEQAAVGVRVGAHPPGARRRLRAHRLHRSAVVAEELVGGVRAHPLLELRAVLVVVPGAGQRHLVGPPRALDGLAVDLRRTGPPLRRDEQDHRPRPALEVTVLAGRAPGLADHVVGLVERRGHLAVHVGGSSPSTVITWWP